MTTPCLLLCLLASSLDFRPSPDIQKCSYCVQMRGLTQSCLQDPLDCAEWDPDSLIYCLSRDEQYWGRDALLKRSTRCISHSNLLNNQTLISELSLILDELKYRCTFDRAQECKCLDCKYENVERKETQIFEKIELMNDRQLKTDIITNIKDISQQFNKLINESKPLAIPINTQQKLKRNKQKHTTKIFGSPLRRQIEQNKEFKMDVKEEKYDKNKTSFKQMPFWPADFLYQFNGVLGTRKFNFNILIRI
ncbi:hypothetical protein Mgra_00006325, partial [Meloidogyne graminicola]